MLTSETIGAAIVVPFTSKTVWFEYFLRSMAIADRTEFQTRAQIPCIVPIIDNSTAAAIGTG
jgi:hypothetical protein